MRETSGKTMPSKTRPYREALLESLSDPAAAASYLTAAKSDSPEMFRKALRNVAQSRQMATVARSAGVTRESLYRATSEIGNPTLDTLDSVLTALGIDITFKAKNAPDSSDAPPIAGAGSNRRTVSLSTNPVNAKGTISENRAYIQNAGSAGYFQTGFTLFVGTGNFPEPGVIQNENANPAALTHLFPAYLTIDSPERNYGLRQDGNANSTISQYRP
jgi:probable addiction module antidote protein